MDVFDASPIPLNLFDASLSTTFPRPPPPSPASPASNVHKALLPSREATASISQGYNYRTPPSHALRYFDANSNCSSDEASEDGDDVPPTPADNSSFRPVTLVSHHLGGGSHGVELSRLFANPGANSARLEEDGSLSLSPVANVFYPSFGDFLPAVKKEEEEAFKANGLGLGGWEGSRRESEETTSARIDSLSSDLADKLELHVKVEKSEGDDVEQTQISSPSTGSSVFAPFATFSPNTDSFTFFPSPDWKTNKVEHGSKEEVTASSADLRSPEPNIGLSTFPMQRSLSLSHVVVTPPSTPARGSSYLSVAPPMQQSRSLPIPAALSPSRSPFALPPSPSPSPTRSSFIQTRAVLPPHQNAGYPLSPIDTERIAKLHNGRIPTLEQLCPEPVHPSSQPPIVNTGNQGVMVVQQGDWKCGTCSFVNWRRRKICLRCFPFANDIGNILTIQSQRAAHLATPMSAPAHQSHFLLPSPTRGRFDLSSSTMPMSRSTSYNPSPNRSPPGYLLVPPPLPQMPHTASPTRSTFALQPPPSPTRYMSSSPSSSPGYQSQHPSFDENRFYSTPSRSPISAASTVNVPSSGDLALRRAAKMSSSIRRHPSIQPLNLANYNQQIGYAQTSPTYDRSTPSRLGHYPYQQRESPPSPTRSIHHSQSQQYAFANGLLGAEL
ncbi:hypothetical protein JCM5350_003835 [Sporobolomyces pararoseus]